MNHHVALMLANDRYWQIVEHATRVKVQYPPAFPTTPIPRGLVSRFLHRFHPPRTAQGFDQLAPTTKPAV